MATSSKTAPTESAPKAATESQEYPASTPEREAGLVPGIPQSALLDQLQDAVFTTDLQGNVTSCNQGAERYGIARKSWLGQNIADAYGIEQKRFVASRALAVALEKGRFDGEFCCRTKAGCDVNVHLCLTLLRDTNAAPAGILGFSIEITGEVPGRKIAECELSPAESPVADEAFALARREIDGTQFLIASPLMHKFMGMVDRVARHTETVLITGETGTGKELVARTIHESSYRRKNALIDINCAALPEHLVESELFGYEKGAFSGADSSKPGLFEMADKSTIFLDEIGELQPQIQVKLLRVLDGAPYYRLGGNRKITVDVRVVAATNQDLDLAVKEGRFRKDLFHRLSQFQLRVPPLRERPEDVAALAQYFLTLKAADKVFSSDAISALQAYPWPGNIRELRNLVAKLAMAEKRQITAPDVQAELNGEPAAQIRGSGAVPLGNLENMEEQMIIRALERTGGHRGQAAEQLGISRRTLSRKLKEYNISVAPGDGTNPLGFISLDQQKFFRARIQLNVTLKNQQGDEACVQGVNLSTGGMGLDGLKEPMRFAGLLEVSFPLPDTEHVFRAKARIVWMGDEGRVGLRFAVIDPALFAQLQQWTNKRMKDEGWDLPA